MMGESWNEVSIFGSTGIHSAVHSGSQGDWAKMWMKGGRRKLEQIFSGTLMGPGNLGYRVYLNLHTSDCSVALTMATLHRRSDMACSQDYGPHWGMYFISAPNI